MPVFTAPPDPADPAQRPEDRRKHPLARAIPFVNDEVPDPCIERMPEVSMLPVVVVLLPTPRPVDTVNWDVEAWPVTAR